VGPYLSDTYKQEMGVPQDSIVLVALLVIKNNNIVNCLAAGVRPSLFLDDFFICYRSKSMYCIERVLHCCFKKIELWAESGGFQFSNPKPYAYICVTKVLLTLNLHKDFAIQKFHWSMKRNFWASSLTQTYFQITHCKSEKEKPVSHETATSDRTC
jgi:hypothetical protein